MSRNKKQKLTASTVEEHANFDEIAYEAKQEEIAQQEPEMDDAAYAADKAVLDEIEAEAVAAATADYSKLTMAGLMDKLIAEDFEPAQAAKICQAESDRRGFRTKYTAGSINAHIKYRANQAAKKVAV